MHIAICDDNNDELSYLSSLLAHYRRERDSSFTYEAFHNATDLLEAMRTRCFDLLLLDILMPEINGMDAAREIRRTNKEIPIIFLTSSREFAVESYQVNAGNYLMKPAQKSEMFFVLDSQLEKLSQAENSLILKTADCILKLPFSQIVFVEVLKRVVQFTLTGGAVREVYGYLAEYESFLLADPAFYKPHRSYVVNLRQVVGLDKKGFTTTTGKIVPVARDSFAKAKAAYMKYLITDKEGDRI